MVTELNQRSRDVFRTLVETYVASGEPVGSRTIAKHLGYRISPATVRNVMADLQDEGLLYAPHLSAGRLPTEAGLRLFVKTILTVDVLSHDERKEINRRCTTIGRSVSDMFGETSSLLSTLSRGIGLVVTPKTNRPLKHIEFVSMAPGRAFIILVTKDGSVENRIIKVPMNLSSSVLTKASNFLNTRLNDQTLEEVRQTILTEIDHHKAKLDELTSKVIRAGLATKTSSTPSPAQLIVRGQAKILEDVNAFQDIDRIRALFDALETRDAVIKLLDVAGQAEGVQIFIGAENLWFHDTGCSLIVTSYKNSHAQVIGAIGIIGPTRLNYARIIPMVDYTAKVLSRLVK
jgi:heat-inducible transcriptional repressor